MKKLTKVVLSILSVAAVGGSTMAFAGCGEQGGTVTITGSTSVQPLMQKLAAAYEELHGDVIINIGGGGSSVGVTDAQSGKSDFGMASRELKDSEKTGDNALVSKKIADDGIALIVNNACTVVDVTTAEVKALYESGTAIQDAIVGALSREAGSGTRDAFEELVGIGSLYKGTGFEEGINQTSAVISGVKGDKTGRTMGYISLGSLSNEVKALKYNGVEPTVDNVKNATYELSRPFNVVYKEGGLSEVAQAFIDWILSDEGQAIVTANGYITIL